MAPANFDPMHIPRACGRTTALNIRMARCKRAFNVASAREEEKRAEEAYRKKVCRKVVSPDTIRKRKRDFFAIGKEYDGTRVEIFQDFLRHSIANLLQISISVLGYRLKISFLLQMSFDLEIDAEFIFVFFSLTD